MRHLKGRTGITGISVVRVRDESEITYPFVHLIFMPSYLSAGRSLSDLQTQNPQNRQAIPPVLCFQIEQIQPKSERQLEEVISDSSPILPQIYNKPTILKLQMDRISIEVSVHNGHYRSSFVYFFRSAILIKGKFYSQVST